MPEEKNKNASPSSNERTELSKSGRGTHRTPLVQVSGDPVSPAAISENAPAGSSEDTGDSNGATTEE